MAAALTPCASAWNRTCGAVPVPPILACPLSVPASPRSGAKVLAIESGSALMSSAISSVSPAEPVAVIDPDPTSNRTASSETFEPATCNTVGCASRADNCPCASSARSTARR
jgi:hypothetical protein